MAGRTAARPGGGHGELRLRALRPRDDLSVGRAVVDEDRGLAAKIRKRPVAAIPPLAPRQLLLLGLRNALDVLVAHVGHGEHLAVEHANTAAGDRAHRQFFVIRNAELSHDENVERRAEAGGDLEPDGDAAAR